MILEKDIQAPLGNCGNDKTRCLSKKEKDNISKKRKNDIDKLSRMVKLLHVLQIIIAEVEPQTTIANHWALLKDMDDFLSGNSKLCKQGELALLTLHYMGLSTLPFRRNYAAQHNWPQNLSLPRVVDKDGITEIEPKFEVDSDIATPYTVKIDT